MAKDWVNTEFEGSSLTAFNLERDARFKEFEEQVRNLQIENAYLKELRRLGKRGKSLPIKKCRG